MHLDIAYRSIPMPGEHHNGDAVIVRHDGERSLVAVIDGLGHGAKAEEVSLQAIKLLETVDLNTSGIDRIMSILDDGLRASRGAAATVCLIEGERLDGCGVGNVELRTMRCAVPVVLSPGILGGRVRSFRYFRGVLEPGCRLVMYSDGLSSRFALGDFDGSDAEQVCDQLLEQFGRKQDDSTVLVADVEAPHVTR